MLIQMYADGRQINGQATNVQEAELPLNTSSEYSDDMASESGVLLSDVNWLEADWRQGSLVDLVDHIVFRHHAYARCTLPRLASLMNEVLHQHGELHPEIIELATTFLDFSSGLLAHMNLEELLLHSRIRELEASLRHAQGTPLPAPARPLPDLIARMEADHQIVHDALDHMRALTHGFTPPAGASVIYRTLLTVLSELDDDMQRHVYEENEMLFPRAIALEQSLLWAA